MELTLGFALLAFNVANLISQKVHSSTNMTKHWNEIR